MLIQKIREAWRSADDILRSNVEAHLRAAGLKAGSFDALLDAAERAGLEIRDCYVHRTRWGTIVGFRHNASPILIRDFAARIAPEVIDTSRTTAHPFLESQWRPALVAAAVAATQGETA